MFSKARWPTVGGKAIYIQSPLASQSSPFKHLPSLRTWINEHNGAWGWQRLWSTQMVFKTSKEANTFGLLFKKWLFCQDFMFNNWDTSLYTYCIQLTEISIYGYMCIRATLFKADNLNGHIYLHTTVHNVMAFVKWHPSANTWNNLACGRQPIQWSLYFMPLYFKTTLNIRPLNLLPKCRSCAVILSLYF